MKLDCMPYEAPDVGNTPVGPDMGIGVHMPEQGPKNEQPDVGEKKDGPDMEPSDETSKPKPEIKDGPKQAPGEKPPRTPEDDEAEAALIEKLKESGLPIDRIRELLKDDGTPNTDIPVH